MKARELSYGSSNTTCPAVLRFPPEPNGYLHLGHARAIRVNFESASRLGGVCNLRFDDSNPEKDYSRYAQMIIDHVEWLTGSKL